MPTVVTYSAVALRLRNVSNAADLERVSHLIQFVPSVADRETLAAIFKERSSFFNQKQKPQ